MSRIICEMRLLTQHTQQSTHPASRPGSFVECHPHAVPGEGAKTHAPVVGERQSQLVAAAADMKDRSPRAQKIREVFWNLYPYVGSDAPVLDVLERAIASGNPNRLDQVVTMTYAMNQARTADVLRAAPIIRDTEFNSLPLRRDPRVANAISTAARVRSMVTDGFKLTIPTDIPIDEYIELIKDYRPQILSLTKDLIKDASTGGDLSLTSLMKSITAINSEIERIKGLRRFMLIEAFAGFSRNHPALTASTLIAGALGLAGHFFGCATAPAVGAVTDVAKRAGKLNSPEQSKRLVRKLHADLQPTLDSLIARCVGTTSIAMHVFSIRKNLAEATIKREKKRIMRQ
jgi:hypothetical protein